MVSMPLKRAVGLFPRRQDAERALYELRDSGFPMNRVAVVNRDAAYDDKIAETYVHSDIHQSEGNKADEGATVGAVSGGVVGALTGLLVGLGALAIPGVGPVMMAGALATTIATALSGTAIGAVAGSLIGALVGLGIPEDRARIYNDRVAHGDYLVVVDGSDAEISKAEAILRRHHIEEFEVYEARHQEVPAEREVRPAAEVPIAATPMVQMPVEASVAPITETPAAVRPIVTDADLARTQHAVGIFARRRDAEEAIRDLREAGFPLSRVSLVAKQFESRTPFAGVQLRDRFEPSTLGFPEERARYYYDRIDRGHYLVMVNGTSDEIASAQRILQGRGIEEFRIYDPATIETDRTGYSYLNSEVGPGVEQRPHAENKVITHHPEVVIVDRRDEVL